MIIESINERVLFIDDSADSGGYIQIEAENLDYGRSCDVFINKDQALKIVEHLEKVFVLERNSKI